MEEKIIRLLLFIIIICNIVTIILKLIDLGLFRL